MDSPKSLFIEHHRIFLKVIGAWPGYTGLRTFLILLGFSWFLMIFAFLNVKDVIHDLNLLMDNLVSTVGAVLSLIKVTVLRLKSRTLIQLMKKMLEDWQSREFRCSEIMLLNLKQSKWVSSTIIIMYNGLLVLQMMMSVKSYLYNAVEDRQFIAPVSLPRLQQRESPYFEIIFPGEAIVAFFCFNSNALTEGLLVSFVLHAGSKINALQHEIIQFSEFSRSRSIDRKLTLLALRKLINEHVKCIKFSEDLDSLFSYISFFHIFLLTLTQVFSGYMFINALEQGNKPLDLLHYAVLTLVFLISCGYYCIAGEYLTNQNELIFGELYNCIWYEFQIFDQNAIKFMMVKARKPICLTFGQFDDLSHARFSQIIKTSFSYLSLVRQVH